MNPVTVDFRKSTVSMKTLPRPIDIMTELDLLSWRSLLVGWKRGWATRADVIDYAVAQLLRGQDDARLTVAQLAGSEHFDGDEILRLLLTAIGNTGPVITLETAAILSDWTPSVYMNADLRREFEQWLLAHLIALSRHKGSSDEVANLADEIWTEFGYPESLAGLSQFYSVYDEKMGTMPGQSRRQSLAEILNEGIETLERELRPP